MVKRQVRCGHRRAAGEEEGMATTTAIPCKGRRCEWARDCLLYNADAKETHGYMDSDEGWTCTEYTMKHKPLKENPEVDDDEGQAQLW